MENLAVKHRIVKKEPYEGRHKTIRRFRRDVRKV
jgi:hypothetical protein